MRRLGHGHTFIAGLVGGLILDKEALVLFGGGVLLGAALVLAWGALAGLVRWARWRLGPPREPELELLERPLFVDHEGRRRPIPRR